MNYTLLGAPLSPFVRKVRVLCAEKGIAYDLEAINPFAPPEGWSEISPLGRVPVLALIDEDGSKRYLPDSSVICACLDQMHPQPSLIPTAPIARGEALWLEEYADSDLAAAIGRGIFQPMIFPRLRGEEPDRTKAEDTMRNAMPRFFDYLEAQIGQHEFLVEDTFSLADIAVATSFVNLAHAGFSTDGDRWPQLAGFIQRMHERPSFAQCIAGERKMLGLG
ncbi:MAG: glutathione S-transferase family protein [Pseudomonadota bacterium]